MYVSVSGYFYIHGAPNGKKIPWQPRLTPPPRPYITDSTDSESEYIKDRHPHSTAKNRIAQHCAAMSTIAELL